MFRGGHPAKEASDVSLTPEAAPEGARCRAVRLIDRQLSDSIIATHPHPVTAQSNEIQRHLQVSARRRRINNDNIVVVETFVDPKSLEASEIRDKGVNDKPGPRPLPRWRLASPHVRQKLGTATLPKKC